MITYTTVGTNAKRIEKEPKSYVAGEKITDERYYEPAAIQIAGMDITKGLEAAKRMNYDLTYDSETGKLKGNPNMKVPPTRYGGDIVDAQEYVKQTEKEAKEQKEKFNSELDYEIKKEQLKG